VQLLNHFDTIAMHDYILKIKEIKLVPAKYGNDIVITKVGAYNSEGKWLKWVKLNEYTLSLLANAEIPFQLPAPETNFNSK
jgi:hypothetical protein